MDPSNDRLRKAVPPRASSPTAVKEEPCQPFSDPPAPGIKHEAVHSQLVIAAVHPWSKRMSKQSLCEQRSALKTVKKKLKPQRPAQTDLPPKKTSSERAYPPAKPSSLMWREGPFSVLEDYLLLKIRCKGHFSYFWVFNRLVGVPVRESLLYSRMRSLKALSLKSFLRLSAIVERNRAAAQSLTVPNYIQFNCGEGCEPFRPAFPLDLNRLSAADIDFDEPMTEEDFDKWTSTVTGFTVRKSKKGGPKVLEMQTNYQYPPPKSVKSEAVESARRSVKHIEEIEDLWSNWSQESVEIHRLSLLSALLRVPVK